MKPGKAAHFHLLINVVASRIPPPFSKKQGRCLGSQSAQTQGSRGSWGWGWVKWARRVLGRLRCSHPTEQSRIFPRDEGLKADGVEIAPVKGFGGNFFFDPLQLDLCNLSVHFIQFPVTAVSQIGAQAAGGSFPPAPDSQVLWLPTQQPCCPKCAILQPYSSGNLIVKGRRLRGGGGGTSELQERQARGRNSQHFGAVNPVGSPSAGHQMSLLPRLSRPDSAHLPTCLVSVHVTIPLSACRTPRITGPSHQLALKP